MRAATRLATADRRPLRGSAESSLGPMLGSVSPGPRWTMLRATSDRGAGKGRARQCRVSGWRRQSRPHEPVWAVRRPGSARIVPSPPNLGTSRARTLGLVASTRALGLRGGFRYSRPSGAQRLVRWSSQTCGRNPTARRFRSRRRAPRSRRATRQAELRRAPARHRDTIAEIVAKTASPAPACTGTSRPVRRQQSLRPPATERGSRPGQDAG
jgi:hypothetical protein